MIEFFHTISSYFDKITTYFHTLFINVQDSITELNTWISYLPTTLISAAAIIVVLLLVFRVLGR